ncbi:MAG: CopD family protein [Sphingomonadaceae bacterium]|nr:CopD family protein [Sphingomonadaceae bacterium]
MIGFLGNVYLWVKAAHVAFVIFWMAGLFMLPRFYAYHQEAERGTPEWARWIERERRLITIILNPAMMMVWALGLALLVNIGAAGEGWFHAKFAAVLLLSAYHGWMVGYARKLAEGRGLVSGRTMRLLNEVPGLATAVIVVLVIVKPF